ncbi:MAG: sugar ABC transporter permease [Chloroflexota bacterium]|nr:sugar ABC transporter permease [Chloroflexota bacterium]
MTAASRPRFRVLPRSAHPQGSGRKRVSSENNTLLVVAFALPGLLIYTVFLFWPLLQAAYYSVWDWNGLGPLTDFVGLQNYARMLDHEVFHIAVGNTLLIIGLSLVIQLPLALMLALMVGRKLPGRSIFRLVLFLPYVFSEVVTAILFQFVYNPDGGLLNVIVTSFGGEAQTWLANRNIALLCVFFVLTWKYFGFHMILYMAGLQQVNVEIEEAARIDGANELNVIRYVTLPSMAPTIRLTIYLSVVGAINQFVLIWTLTTGGPANATHVLATYMFRFGIKSFNLSYGAAAAVAIFVCALTFAVLYQRFVLNRDTAGQPD